MNDETRRELCKAFAYNVPIDTIADIHGMTKDELIQFADDNKGLIAEVQEHYRKMG